MERPIYLDHNGSTAIESQVLEAMVDVAGKFHGNPSSAHQFGRAARIELDDARREIGSLIGASPVDRVLLTSGATESNNLALLGVLRRSIAKDRTRDHLLISSVEHSSVFQVAEHWLDLGGQVDLLPVDDQGRVDPESLSRAIRPTTCLVSVTATNHETGVIQPIHSLAEIARNHSVLFHTDAVALIGKRPFSFADSHVDLMSLTAHKIYGPVGVGALIVRSGVELTPLVYGGHQQDGLRCGTESVFLAEGLRVALRRRIDRMESESIHLAKLRDRLETGLLDRIYHLTVHSQKADRIAGVTNLGFPQVSGKSFFDRLDSRGIIASIGAACSSSSNEPSPTLLAIGVDRQLARSSVRFSLGIENSPAEIETAIKRIAEVYAELHAEVHNGPLK
jgi:cysteine desulfurase